MDINVTDVRLCRELYELSGWDDTFLSYFLPDDYARDYLDLTEELDNYDEGRFDAPAYDFGFLLRKLPSSIPGDKNWFDLYAEDGGWRASYEYATSEPFDPFPSQFASAPEDAVAKLAIELFKQRIIKKEE